VGTKPQNRETFARINEGFLHAIGPDGRYNRDRIFASLGIPPGKDGDYGRNFGLNDKDRERVKAAIERELGIKFPKGVEIDPAGNMNENEGVGKYAKDWKTYAAIGGAATGLGALGIGPLSGLFGAGAGAGSGAGAGAAASGAGAAGAGAAGTAAGAVGAASKAAGAVTAAKKAMSTYDIAKDVIGAIGGGTSEAADTMAHNRGVRMSAAAEAEALNVARRRDDRDSRNDAHRAYLQSQYLSDPNRGRGPSVAGAYSRPIPSLPKLDPAIVAARRDEAAKRLQTPYQDFAFSPDDLRAGGMEKAANIASTAAGIAQAVPEGVWRKLGRLIFAVLLFASAAV
jgi:hypothetical protein